MPEITSNAEKINIYKKRAKELVSKMTLEEKVFQMLHKAPAVKRLGIKAYNWWNESLHGVARAGVATVFPQAIGLAATFDEDFIEIIADAISTEGRAKFNMQQNYDDTDIYKGLTFWSPNVNIFRDPRWGRGHETYGEDPFLTSRLGIRFIYGIQGHDEDHLKAAACAKHFAVHSGPESLRHKFNALASKQDMAETYLPAFKACVQEGKVEAVMGAYNRTNGEPCCGSKTLLQDILRDEWGFDGHVVSDCWAIKDFHEHHCVTKNAEESVAMAVNNGCDINCGNIFVNLLGAVEKGLVEEAAITRAAENLFTTRMKLGLFDESEKVAFNGIPYNIVDCEKHRELNLKAARESIVLLKNCRNTLPLDSSKIKSIGVIGPNANSRKALVGNYEGTASRYITILEGIQDYLADTAVRVFYSEGCHLFKDKMSNLSEAGDRLAEAKAVCHESDVIVVCVGLDSGIEGEEGDAGNEFSSGDKRDLKLPGLQEKLLEIACESKKPVVVVNLSGSAIDLRFADANAEAIIQGWYPGAQGGQAMAEIIFGKAAPQGKLPVTFYQSTEELPEFTDYSMQNRTYRYMRNAALYPFGYGLTYSDYEISNLKLSKNILDANGIDVILDIKNIGSNKMCETVQAYVSFENGGEHTPVYQLKGFCKVSLDANQSKTVELHLPPSAFALANEDGKFLVNAGEYTLYAGCSQPDTRSAELLGKNPLNVNVKVTQTFALE